MKNFSKTKGLFLSKNLTNAAFSCRPALSLTRETEVVENDRNFHCAETEIRERPANFNITRFETMLPHKAVLQRTAAKGRRNLTSAERRRRPHRPDTSDEESRGLSNRGMFSSQRMCDTKGNSPRGPHGRRSVIVVPISTRTAAAPTIVVIVVPVIIVIIVIVVPGFVVIPIIVPIVAVSAAARAASIVVIVVPIIVITDAAKTAAALPAVALLEVAAPFVASVAVVVVVVVPSVPTGVSEVLSHVVAQRAVGDAAQDVAEHAVFRGEDGCGCTEQGGKEESSVQHKRSPCRPGRTGGPYSAHALVFGTFSQLWEFPHPKM